MPGEYELAVEEVGFATWKQTVRLEVAQRMRLEIRLKLASLTSATEVAGRSAEVLRTTDASLGEVVEPTASSESAVEWPDAHRPGAYRPGSA